MFRRTLIAHAVALAVALPLPGIALAEEDDESYFDEIEYYGYLKNESSVFLRDGTVTGAARNQFNRNPSKDHQAGDALKFENSARVFLNGPVGEESSWHLDLNAIYDTKGVNNYYQGHQAYTQNDWFREGYFDTFVNTPAGPLDLRLGKQQVVWGTADGIKLLDIVNPTDFREFVQNTMEDSRIPVFMAKAELAVGETDNIQVLVSQAKENKYPGLSRADVGSTKAVTGNPFAGTAVDNSAIRGADRDQPFIALGTDSITGGVNGFRNITPALGAVANTFNLASQIFLASPVGLAPFSGVTVQNFANNDGGLATAFGCGTMGLPSDGGACLDAIAQFTNQNITNLTNSTFDSAKPTAAFEYLNNATFATFNTFVNAKSDYKRNYPSDWESGNFGTRYKGSLFGGSFNYSVNYLYAYDNNPSVKLRWKNDSGERLNVKYQTDPFMGTQNQTILLKDSQGRSYGAFEGDVASPDGTAFGTPINRFATLEFEERVHRLHNIGASFDNSLDVGVLTNPLVVRGEFLYQPDVRVPQIDRDRLSIGDLTNGLTPVKADFFKYVIGLDFLVWTNLTVSTQFIQFVNLDYKGGNNRYTADPGTLHLTNGLQDGQEYDNYYSLFLSKPFGESQLGRFNNIILYEQGRGGGWWNRMDVEYQFNDSLVGNVEWNQYWGDENSIFGQFDKSSNFQVGVKYIFE